MVQIFKWFKNRFFRSYSEVKNLQLLINIVSSAHNRIINTYISGFACLGFWEYFRKRDNSKLMSLNYPLEFAQNNTPFIWRINFSICCCQQWLTACRGGQVGQERNRRTGPETSLHFVLEHIYTTIILAPYFKWKFTSVSSLLIVLKQNYIWTTESISNSKEKLIKHPKFSHSSLPVTPYTSVSEEISEFRRF